MSGEEAQPPKKEVVFTFQGAFGPPTYGHYMSMKKFAEKISRDYPDHANKVTMLFMPTGNSSDKKHLYPTQSDRKAALDVFCDMLKSESGLSKLNFETSEIEYDIVNEGVRSDDIKSKPKSNPVTIKTIDELKLKYSQATILVGMGLDNMFELPFWARIDEYAGKCEKIYVVDRDLSEDDKQKVKTCVITNKSSGEAAGGEAGGENKVQIQIKASKPDWWNKDQDPEITKKMAKRLGFDATSINTNDKLNDAMTQASEFNYDGDLPEIVIIQTPPNQKIPGTSSTLLRKLIASFNALGAGAGEHKEEFKKMIQTMMFGPKPTLDSDKLDTIFDQTIRGYLRESLLKVESKLCDDITTILKQAEHADIDAYKTLFHSADAGGGYRKKTRKNKKKSTKRRLRKVKMNSRNLRMKKKISRSRK
jgi:nicotinic acid mononucleotide adenylyltransferase